VAPSTGEAFAPLSITGRVRPAPIYPVLFEVGWCDGECTSEAVPDRSIYSHLPADLKYQTLRQIDKL
jgi:hypothetical protein